jgi:hypothetical protein
VDDLPFAKLSNGSLNEVKCGWKRMARQKIVNQNRKIPLYTIQATAWKDKNLVGFLHSHLVEDIQDAFTVAVALQDTLQGAGYNAFKGASHNAVQDALQIPNRSTRRAYTNYTILYVITRLVASSGFS